MRRNFLLLFAIFAVLLLGFNSFKRIVTLRGTSEKVFEAESKLEELKANNERLKLELEYKKSDEFAEREIRDKLGLSREDEEVFLVPKDNESQTTEVINMDTRQNWQKWKDLFLGS